MVRGVLITVFTAIVFSAHAQVDSLGHKLDSLKKQSDTIPQQNIIESSTYTENTQITFPVYFQLLWSDLKQQITAPVRGNKQDWMRFAGLAVGTAVLSYADKPIQEKALEWRNSSSTLRDVSKNITNMGGVYETYILLGLGTYGFVFKSEKVKTTTLLATQSYLTAGLIQTLLKNLTSRQRPNYIDPVTGQPSPKFHGPFYNADNDFKSFPSGHTTAAFAAATVYAMEYRKSVVVPIVAYTAASLVGLSRISENKHWATDVLLGATLGYLCGRVVVNNYHRYAKLKKEQTKTNNRKSISMTLNYNYGVLQPGVVYRF